MINKFRNYWNKIICLSTIARETDYEAWKNTAVYVYRFYSIFFCGSFLANIIIIFDIQINSNLKIIYLAVSILLLMYLINKIPLFRIEQRNFDKYDEKFKPIFYKNIKNKKLANYYAIMIILSTIFIFYLFIISLKIGGCLRQFM